ncbi:hypothetical protein MMC26_001336 [Xylographa opegraphella]|nr:hypothetical protein [Xylographa opegraphella]
MNETKFSQGRAIAQQFVQSYHPYTGIFTVRDPQNPNVEPLLEVLRSSAKQYSTRALELRSLFSVRRFAAEINTQVASGALKPIRALVLNAGYQSQLGQRFTKDGYEVTFQVNYLANFLLVLLLLESMDKENGRIIFISSWTHDPANTYNRGLKLKKTMWRPFSDLARPAQADGKGLANQAGMRRYAESKLWLMMFMYELQHRIDANQDLSGISALSVDPGGIFTTDIMRNNLWVFRVPLRKMFQVLTPCAQCVSPNGYLRTANKSARDVLNACFANDESMLAKSPKALYINGSAVKQSSMESRDQQKQHLLWEGSLKLVDLDLSETALIQDPYTGPFTSSMVKETRIPRCMLSDIKRIANTKRASRSPKIQS